MKKLGCIILMFMMLFLLCACDRSGKTSETETYLQGGLNSSIVISDSGKKLKDLVTRKYSDDELEKIICFSGSIIELDSKYPIECIREDTYVYRVSYMGNTSVAVLEFGKVDMGSVGRIYELKHTKEEFNGIKVGDTLNSVIEFEPNGDYPFLYLSSSEIPKISTHCTIDGYYILIQYRCSDDGMNYVVESITVKFV